MIPDYARYELNRRETVLFAVSGYFLIAAAVFLFYRSFLLSLLAGVLVRLGFPWYRDQLAMRRARKLQVQFRDMLYSLSASISSGRQMEEALAEAADQLSLVYEPQEPIMVELNHMKRRITENGESDMILLSDFARRSCSEDIRTFVQVYLTCRSTGSDLEKIITHTSEVITEKMEINEQIHVITAQKKLEGRMISCMPFAMLAGLNLLSSSYISVLYTTWPGRLIMTLSLAGTAAGIWLMERFSDVEI